MPDCLTWWRHCKDVYKRQSLTFYIRNRRKRLAEAEERIDALTRLLEDAQKVSDNQEAVSYTHLDVYKRQVVW